MNKIKCIRHIGVALIPIALFLIILASVPLPIKVDRTMNGIRWENGDGQWSEECQVTVNGWYYRYLLKDNFFEGEICFTTADETISYHAPKLTFFNHDPMFRDRGCSLLVYDGTLNQMRSLGYLAVSGNFQGIFIHSDEWNFSAPAEDLDEAMKLAEELTTEEWYKTGSGF